MPDKLTMADLTTAFDGVATAADKGDVAEMMKKPY